MSRYRKTIAAVVGGLITWAYTALADNHVTTLEWIGLAAAVATALGVYQIANQPPAGEASDPAISEQDPPVTRRRRRKGDTGLTALGVVVLVVVVFLLAGVLGTTVHPLFWLILVLLLLALVL